MARHLSSSLLVATCYLSAGKTASAQIACTGVLVPAIVVRVSDSKTGAPLADSARAVVRENHYADTLGAFEYTKEGLPRSLQGAGERVGTYEVEVTRPGYSVWRAHGVKVTRDTCHVHSAYLDAQLERLP